VVKKWWFRPRFGGDTFLWAIALSGMLIVAASLMAARKMNYRTKLRDEYKPA
jgi:hypothetical protein